MLRGRRRFTPLNGPLEEKVGGRYASEDTKPASDKAFSVSDSSYRTGFVVEVGSSSSLFYWTSHLYEDPIEFVHETVYTLISVSQRP